MVRFVGLLVVLLGVVATPASAARLECGPRGAHNATKSRVVRVYRVQDTASGEGVHRLRLHGDTLRWLHGKTVMSYRLR